MLLVDLKFQKSINEFISKQGNDTSFNEEFYDDCNPARIINQKAIPLSLNDWKFVQTIARILEPLNEATLAMCADKVPTISLMMPFFDSILDELKKNAAIFRVQGEHSEDADIIANGMDAAHGKLTKYFDISSDLTLVATILDPRLKLEYYSNAASCLALAEKTVQLLAIRFELDAGIDAIIESIQSAVSDDPPLPAFLRNKRRPTAHKSTIDELRQYINEGTIDIDKIKPLEWWHSNRYRFPKLIKIAQVILSIPATSAASERAFSAARLVMPWNRTKLAGSTLRAIMCLRSWLELSNEDISDLADDPEL